MHLSSNSRRQTINIPTRGEFPVFSWRMLNISQSIPPNDDRPLRVFRAGVSSHVHVKTAWYIMWLYIFIYDPHGNQTHLRYLNVYHAPPHVAPQVTAIQRACSSWDREHCWTTVRALLHAKTLGLNAVYWDHFIFKKCIYIRVIGTCPNIWTHRDICCIIVNRENGLWKVN